MSEKGDNSDYEEFSDSDSDSDSDSSVNYSEDGDDDEKNNDEIPEEDEDGDNFDVENDEKPENDDNDTSSSDEEASDKSNDDTDVSFYDEDDVESDDEDFDKNKKMNSVSSSIPVQNLNVNDDDDDDEDENYLQKFNRESNKNFILEFHPECIIHNHDEVVSLTHLVRNRDGIVIDDLHKTVPFLTKFEKTRVLGQRSKQIENGAKPFIQVPDNIIDAYIIAEMELSQKKIPFIIRRPIPGGKFEYWNLKDLEQLCF